MTEPTPPAPPGARDDEWERQHLYALFADDIPGCGCGHPGEAYNLIRDLLGLIPLRDGDNRQRAIGLIGTPGAVQLVLSVLSDADLTDHGSIITAPWLTDRGKYALWLMGRHEWFGSGEHAADGVCMAGYPPCFDHDSGEGCPVGCWTAPAGVLPAEPPAPTMDELLAAATKEVADARARLNPFQRVVAAEVDRMMENFLLYGQHPAPEQSRQDAPPNIAWPTGLLPGDWSTVSSQEIVFPDPGYVGNLRRAVAPQPAEEDRLPRGGRSVFIGCRRVDLTWVHGRPHTCPRHARG